MRTHKRMAIATAAFGAAALLAITTIVLGSAKPATANTTGAPATNGGIKVAYFDQWSIYQNAFYPKNLDTQGIAGKLDYLLYDFANVHPTDLTCFEATKAASQDENDPNAGDGAGDAFADYQKSFGADISVDGVGDVWNQPIAGNFNQLLKLKKKYPHLKILMSLGGWTYSKFFSDAAATDASRKKLVSSCISMFIKGNLPAQGGYGGDGTAKGLFDGFDIDWEYPGGGGHLGNHASAADKQDFTLLLAEFRSQLNAQGAADGKTYALTAAVSAGQDKIRNVETDKIGQYLTFADVMTYDMHGGWEATGPTNHQSPIYSGPNDPMTPVPPGNAKYSIDEAIKAYTAGDAQYGIPGGFPAAKLNMGVPFYYRGWTGVAAGGNHGLFQPASGPAPGAPNSGNVAGIRMYKELSGVVDNPSVTYWDDAAKASYFYDGTNFWSGESKQSIQAKADYLHCNGMGGTMMFSLYDLDPATTLFNAAVTATNGSAPSNCSAPPTQSPTPTPTGSPSPSPTVSPTSSPTPPVTVLSNGNFESGSLSPWTCSGGGVQNTTKHSGTYALSATPTSSDTAQCTQTITVQPNTAYTLKGWVNGSNTYLGITAGASTWATTGGAWQQLTVSFNSGSAGSVTVYLHGWYGTGTYYADDITLS
ncbi:glycosyl hydrolase family 18 protein [Fodinicola acaciae]|uniref:glycosyl hydrolase family 18 protein n=1 Tax=Fodinicola acaciae TaxID=2681555 RepID=UPI0013D40528|nr:glycosyl hydrolase family 18 protein [Fodinicola acaciae]